MIQERQKSIASPNLRSVPSLNLRICRLIPSFRWLSFFNTLHKMLLFLLPLLASLKKERVMLAMVPLNVFLCLWLPYYRFRSLCLPLCDVIYVPEKWYLLAVYLPRIYCLWVGFLNPNFCQMVLLCCPHRDGLHSAGMSQYCMFFW